MQAVEPAAPAPALHPGLDDSVQAFIKLKELQPQQQELQAALERDGNLGEDDQEALEFLSDEIQRLMEVLRQHGFNFPECGLSQLCCSRHARCSCWQHAGAEHRVCTYLRSVVRVRCVQRHQARGRRAAAGQAGGGRRAVPGLAVARRHE